MANPEHLKILKQGVEVWNRWKESMRDGAIDLRGANLQGLILNEVNLSHVDLQGADLRKVSLLESNLIDANLIRANIQDSSLGGAHFFNAKLKEANLSNSFLDFTDLRSANLTQAKFVDSDLSEANFIDAILDGTDFSGAYLGGSIFGNTDLSTCKGLERVEVSGPCIIDFHTLRASRNLPKSFLLKIGLPENYINYLPDFFDETPIRMYPVFLSHSWQNKDFANKLYNALINRGVQVWYDEKKMKPGDDIYESLSRGIEVYDKMILVCSRQSLEESWWVDREIDRILAKERQLQKERGKRINLLVPIRIDDHIFEWDGAKGEEVRRYIIGDFRHWQDEAKFQKALDELIAALNVDRGEDAPPSFL